MDIQELDLALAKHNITSVAYREEYGRCVRLAAQGRLNQLDLETAARAARTYLDRAGFEGQAREDLLQLVGKGCDDIIARNLAAGGSALQNPFPS